MNIHNNNNDCNICYEYYDEIDNLIVLNCCNNTKRICLHCITCLTTFICPYCRKELNQSICDIINKNNIKIINNNHQQLSFSAPNTSIDNNYLFNTTLYNDYLIDPFADYYHNRDTRVLRRRMRQLRKQILNQSARRTQTLYHINNYNNNNSNYNNQKTNKNRKNMKNYTNKITHQLQRNSNNGDDSNYLDIEDTIFNLDD